MQYDEPYVEEPPHENQEPAPEYNHGEYVATEEIEGDMYPDEQPQESHNQIDNYQDEPYYQDQPQPDYGYHEEEHTSAPQEIQPPEYDVSGNNPEPVGETAVSEVVPEVVGIDQEQEAARIREAQEQEALRQEQEAQRQQEEAKRQEEAKVQAEQEALQKEQQEEQVDSSLNV